MGGMQRAWACAGGRWMIDVTVDDSYLILAGGERPVLCLAPGLSIAETEKAFGWALSDLLQQQATWVGLLRHATQLIAA